jgi:CspA family cold shock protein
MAVILEDLIKLLDSVSNSMRRGRYPDDASSRKIAAMLHKVAEDMDA